VGQTVVSEEGVAASKSPQSCEDPQQEEEVDAKPGMDNFESPKKQPSPNEESNEEDSYYIPAINTSSRYVRTVPPSPSESLEGIVQSPSVSEVLRSHDEIFSPGPALLRDAGVGVPRLSLTPLNYPGRRETRKGSLPGKSNLSIKDEHLKPASVTSSLSVNGDDAQVELGDPISPAPSGSPDLDGLPNFMESNSNSHHHVDDHSGEESLQPFAGLDELDSRRASSRKISEEDLAEPVVVVKDQQDV